MSVWTYFKSTIVSPVEIDIEKYFGREFIIPDVVKGDWRETISRMYEDYEKHKEDYLPLGSEGSLTVKTSAGNNKFIYNICGNLRNWSDDVGLLQWFEKKFLHMKIDMNIECTAEAYSSMGVGEWKWSY